VPGVGVRRTSLSPQEAILGQGLKSEKYAIEFSTLQVIDFRG
jgi:hypothetical protein